MIFKMAYNSKEDKDYLNSIPPDEESDLDKLNQLYEKEFQKFKNGYEFDKTLSDDKLRQMFEAHRILWYSTFSNLTNPK